MEGLIGLDFETYGAVDLKKHGLARYLEDKSFMPLLGGAVWNDPQQQVYINDTYDFTRGDIEVVAARLEERIGDRTIVPFNAGFEQGVLDWLGLHYPSDRFIDAAVVARAVGGGSHLEAAAPQLLSVDKDAMGKQLIKLFSVPGKYQEDNGTPFFDAGVINDHPQEWTEFLRYCILDARLGLRIVEKYHTWLLPRERTYAAITLDMNRAGWPVDVEIVEEMNHRYLENQDAALADFRFEHEAHDLNLNSLKQMKEWCSERGVRATSFDEAHVDRYLKRITEKLYSGTLSADKVKSYTGVRDLLETKQILGGSALKKLQTILNLVVEDGTHGYRLLDQYVHCGAGQTLRTTGRAVQMQNLKRLGPDVDDVDELILDPAAQWDNDRLAANIRQVFTSCHKQGRLIVGDFSSVESRGLAYLAGDRSKLKAFADGKDMYKVMAASPEMYGVPYDEVTKEQRQAGKVGELSCGYQAGGGAVADFAAKMGVEMTEAEAVQLVASWRKANPDIVRLWENLDDMLRKVVDGGSQYEKWVNEFGLTFEICEVLTPDSLLKQAGPHVQSISLVVLLPNGQPWLKRYFHGAHARGNEVRYFKPSDRKTGDLWRDGYVHPKTKVYTHYTLYGGKLAGIMTQSFCRELFMQSLDQVSLWAQRIPNVRLIGQFHDEIVVDWWPCTDRGAVPLSHAMDVMEMHMSDAGAIKQFPLQADIKCDYRYTK